MHFCVHERRIVVFDTAVVYTVHYHLLLPPVMFAEQAWPGWQNMVIKAV